MKMLRPCDEIAIRAREQRFYWRDWRAVDYDRETKQVERPQLSFHREDRASDRRGYDRTKQVDEVGTGSGDRRGEVQNAAYPIVNVNVQK